MTHTPHESPVDPDVTAEESLDQADVAGRLDLDPSEQRNREDAPDPEDLPEPGADPRLSR